MHISENGLHLIEQFEGLRLQRYLDSVGVPTIGYGTTASVIDPVPEACTEPQAEAWLRIYVERECEPAVNGLGVPLNQNQFDALCSLVYNCGPGVIGWQIGLDLRARRYGAAAQDFLAYVYAGGHVLQGLVNRRQEERALFLTAATPVTPPDPHHYGWFDRTERHLANGRSGCEHDLVIEYDRERARWRVFPRRLKRVRDDLGILAGRLETVMSTDAAQNDALRRRWRHDQLAGRADGRRYV